MSRNGQSRLDFVEEDLDYGEVQAKGYIWRDLYKRRREEDWLDSLSEPPDESELYGESLVVEGVRVGEWKYADKTEPDAIPLGPCHHAGVRPLTEEEREALIEEQRKPPPPPPPPVEVEPELVKLSEEERIRAELRAMPVPPALAAQWRQYHDGEDYDDEAEGRRLRIEHARQQFERDRWRREQTRKKKEAEKAEREKPRIDSFGQWAATHEPAREPRRVDSFGQWPHPPSRPIEPSRQRQPVRLTDRLGIEHIVPVETYTRFGHEAIKLGVDPPVWVLYRLGFGWNE